MKKIGIVCEFNPFHKGHEYLINEARRQAGDDCTIICVMSGDFVQRGEPALYRKSARAEAACRSGADLVVELPLYWSLSSAEGFAEGAVKLLHELGAEYICFGSESGDLKKLSKLAKALNDKETVEEIKKQLAAEANTSFAFAREKVLSQRQGEIGVLLREPNNILAVEYLKAIYKLNYGMKPMTVKRIGSGHDEDGETVYKSSSELRRLILSGENVTDYIPAAAMAVYRREDESGQGRICTAKLEQAIMSRLRMLGEETFDNLPDSAGGAGKRLYKAVCEESGLEDIMQNAKTKRFAMARIRRMCMCAALGVTKDDVKMHPQYARILAANAKGCSLLRELNDKESFPIVTKPAAVRSLSDDINKVFASGVYAHDLYVLANASLTARKPGQDWKNGPVIVQN